MPAPLDLIGRRFERLTVIAQNGMEGRARKWDCVCDCGTSVNVVGAQLVNGNTKSCGCYRRDIKRAQMAVLNKTHGMSHTPEHYSWWGMLRRCSDPTVRSFKLYGARGISVCERWQDFENFYADMGPRPSARHSIGRIDNDMGYSPENCRWETPTEQALNTRRNVVITAFGRTAPLGEFVEASGPDYKRVWKRLRRGWDAERALTEPNDPRGGRNASSSIR